MDQWVESLAGMLQERGIGRISELPDGRVSVFVYDGGKEKDGERSGRAWQFNVDAGVDEFATDAMLAYTRLDAKSIVLDLLGAGESIDGAYRRMSRMRNSLETISMLSDELACPMSSYAVVKHVTSVEYACFDGPAGMTPEEARKYYDENVDDCELFWNDGDVIDSNIDSITEEERER